MLLQMEASEIYKCIADTQRLRILNLLNEGPLCVCHLQAILEVPQVKMSKQLAIMKQLGLLTATREGTWMVYSLSPSEHGLLRVNLKYLREAQCAECNQLQQDLSARQSLVSEISKSKIDCPESVCG